LPSIVEKNYHPVAATHTNLFQRVCEPNAVLPQLGIADTILPRNNGDLFRQSLGAAPKCFG
jgi:hypothetical protein